MDPATKLDLQPVNDQGPQLRVATSTPDANLPERRDTARQKISQTMTRLDASVGVVDVQLKTPAAATTASPQNQIERPVSATMSIADLEKEIRVQEKLLNTEEQIAKLDAELRPLQFFTDQAGRYFNQLKQYNLLLPLARLKQAHTALQQEENRVRQENLKQPVPKITQEIPTLIALTNQNKFLAEVIQFAEVNDLHKANFDKGVQYVNLVKNRDNLRTELKAGSTVSAESIGILQKTLAQRTAAEQANFDYLRSNAIGIKVLLQPDNIIGFKDIASFDKRAQPLIEQLSKITDGPFQSQAQQFITELQEGRAMLAKRLRSTPPPIPTIATQPKVAAAPRPSDTPTIQVPVVDTNAVVTAKASDTPTVQIPVIDAKANPTIVQTQNPFAQRKQAQSTAPQTRAQPTPPPVPQDIADASRARAQSTITQTRGSVNNIRTDTVIDAPVAPRQSAPTQPQIISNTASDTLRDIPVVQPQTVPTQLQGTPNDTIVNQPAITVPARPIPQSNNRPTIPDIDSPTTTIPVVQAATPDVQNSVQERVVDLGAMRTVIQSEAQKVIDQYPHKVVPAEVFDQWRSAAEQYLAQQNRSGDIQLVLSIATLFDAHNKAVRSPKGRLKTFGAWARNLLNQDSSQAEDLPDAPTNDQVVDDMLDQYAASLSVEDRNVLKTAISESLKKNGVIDPSEIADRAEALYKRRQGIKDRLATRAGRKSRRDTSVDDDKATQVNLPVDDMQDFPDQAERYNAQFELMMKAIKTNATPSATLEAMFAAHAVPDLDLKAVVMELQKLEESQGMLRGTPALQKAVDHIDALLVNFPDISKRLQIKLLQYGLDRDNARAQAIVNNVAAPQANIPTEINLDAVQPQSDVLKTISEGDPDEAFGAAIAHFEKTGNGSMVYALRDIDQKVNALLDLASTNVDRVHERSVAGFLAAIPQVLGKENDSIAQALVKKLEQRVKIQNTLIEEAIRKEDDEDELNANTQLDLPIAEVKTSTTEALHNDASEDADLLAEQAHHRKLMQLENRAIEMMNDNDALSLKKLIQLYEDQGESEIVYQLRALRTTLPRVGLDNIIHTVSPVEIFQMANQINHIPDISQRLRRQLQARLGSYLNTWNIKAERDAAKRNSTQAEAA